MWRASLLFLAAVAVGCSPSTPGPPQNATVRRRNLEPKLDATTSLVLDRLSKRLKVGDDDSIVQEFYPKPTGAYVFKDLPDRLGGDFEAHGWESRDESFGVIFYSGRVAAAMRQLYGIDAGRYDEILATTREMNRQSKVQTLTGDNIEFTFWESEPQVLMILRRGLKQGVYDMTIALGDRGVMESLDMTPAKAQGIIDRLAQDANGKSNAKEPTPRGNRPATDSGPKKADGPR